MGCVASKESQVQEPDGPKEAAAAPETQAASAAGAGKADKLKFRQPTVIDLLGDERAELDAKLLRWATKIFDEIDADGKGHLTGPDLAAALKKLPSAKAPKLAPVCPSIFRRIATPAAVPTRVCLQCAFAVRGRLALCCAFAGTVHGLAAFAR